MKLNIAPDTWENVREQIGPLWLLHYEEIADKAIPLSPDWDNYGKLDRAGLLQIVSARHGGALVGYAFALVGLHLHYSTTLFANFDLYYLHPDCRTGFGYVRLIREMERTLKARGVVKIVGNTKLAHDASVIFHRLGWHETERIFTKRL